MIDIPRNPDCLGLPFVKDDKKDDKKELPDIQKIILSSIFSNDKITVPELTRKAEVSESTISVTKKNLMGTNR